MQYESIVPYFNSEVIFWITLKLSETCWSTEKVKNEFTNYSYLCQSQCIEVAAEFSEGLGWRRQGAPGSDHRTALKARPYSKSRNKIRLPWLWCLSWAGCAHAASLTPTHRFSASRITCALRDAEFGRYRTGLAMTLDSAHREVDAI